MAGKSAVPADFAAAGSAEPFGCALICFHLWHFKLRLLLIHHLALLPLRRLASLPLHHLPLLLLRVLLLLRL